MKVSSRLEQSCDGLGVTAVGIGYDKERMCPEQREGVRSGDILPCPFTPTPMGALVDLGGTDPRTLGRTSVIETSGWASHTEVGLPQVTNSGDVRLR